MILGVAIYKAGRPNDIGWIFFPLVVLAFGHLASMVGVLSRAQPREGRVSDPMSALNRGYYVVAGSRAVGHGGRSPRWCMLDDVNGWFAVCGLIGILTSIAFVFITQYYTAGN